MSDTLRMLSGPRRKFCEGIVAGLNATEAYRAAYPKASLDSARVNGSRLLTFANVCTEIADLRESANRAAGSSFLSYTEKRSFYARVVRAVVSREPQDSDLWQSVKIRDGVSEFRLPDKLAAIAADNDLAGQGSEAEANDALSALLHRCMR